MSYPSDLTDLEWTLIEPLLPPAQRMGRPRKYPLRRILDAMFYIDRTGCQWRYLPGDFPKWNTVYDYSRRWSVDDTMVSIHDALRRRLREELDRAPAPSVAIIDSQSVKTSQKGGRSATTEARRSRDENAISWWILWACFSKPGSTVQAYSRERIAQSSSISSRLEVVWADWGYRSGPLARAIRQQWQAELEIKKHPWQGSQYVRVLRGTPAPYRPRKPKGFVVLPKRWIVEQTFAWLNLHRRHSKDYETHPQQSLFFIHLSMVRNMLKRLNDLIE